MIAAAGIDPSVYLAGGGVVALFGFTASLLFRSQRREDRIASMQDGRIEALVDDLGAQRVSHAVEIAEMRGAHNAEIREARRLGVECERRVNILMVLCQKAGMEIPSEVWKTDAPL